jgi:hypothetical protein
MIVMSKSRKAAVVTLSVMASGCAIVPNVIRPEIEHMSHTTQHEPFTSHPTRYGTNLAGVTAGWRVGKRWQIEANESVALPGDQHCGNAWGEVMGPRESFSLRIGYNFEVKK